MQFNTFNLLGGMLPVVPDASKIPDGSYKIGRNIRVRDNVVRPVLPPLNISSGLPHGRIQGGDVMGEWMIVFIGGTPYARNIFYPSSVWQPLNGYSLDGSVDVIYTKIVPLAFNTFKRNINGNTDGAIPQVANGFYSDQGGGLPCLVAQDGINQPLLIHPDASGGSFTCRAARKYSEWTPDNPEYVPIGKMMEYDGKRLHIVIKGRFAYEQDRMVARSVGNRPLDFMIVLDSDGNKLVDESQGDARIMSYGVDFDKITALRVFNNNQPAIMVCTNKQIWQAVPDFTDTNFGEPTYNPVFLSGTGVVSHQGFAETTINVNSASTAFVSQSGIRAINTASQNRFEGRNYPLSRSISKLFEGVTQLTGAAVGFNDYSYFAVETIYGFGIVVYDTTLSQWVSVDSYISQAILLFVVARIPGAQKLIALTSSSVWEMESDNIIPPSPGIYLGDYAQPPVESIRVEQITTQIRYNFIDSTALGTLRATVYCDGRLDKTGTSNIPLAKEELVSQPFPFTDQLDATGTISIQGLRQGFRAGFWLEWNTRAALSYFSIDTIPSNTVTNISQKIAQFKG